MSNILEAIQAVIAKPDTKKPEPAKFDTQFSLRLVPHKGNYQVPAMGFATSTSASSPSINPSGIAGCREIFAGKFTDSTKCMFFNAGSRPRILSLTLFFRILEDKLNLREENRTRFMHYGANGVVVVSLSPWWVKSHLRRQLFTILLRCGSNFTGNFDDALKSDKYAKDTLYAVQRFISGYTKQVSGVNYDQGWMNLFNGKSKDMVNKYLAKPE